MIKKEKQGDRLWSDTERLTRMGEFWVPCPDTSLNPRMPGIPRPAETRSRFSGDDLLRGGACSLPDSHSLIE